MPSVRVDVSRLKAKAQRFDPQRGLEVLEQVAREKGVATLISQAIADNFDKEGPGWAPLSPVTIRASVAKKLRKSLKGKSPEQIRQMEAKARAEGSEPMRKILQRTGLLKRTATTPGFSGSSKSGASGSNVYQVSGTQIRWGTSLSYAAIHQNGDGRIPKRPFLVIRDEWKRQLEEYVLERCKQLLLKLFRSGS